MNINEIKESLHLLDSLIDEKLSFDICGGAACVLKHGIDRVTFDIDVISPDPDLNNFKDQIGIISREKGGDFQDSCRFYHAAFS